MLSLTETVTEPCCCRPVGVDGAPNCGLIDLVIGAEIAVRHRLGGACDGPGAPWVEPIASAAASSASVIAARTIMAAREIQPRARGDGDRHQREPEHHRDIAGVVAHQRTTRTRKERRLTVEPISLFTGLIGGGKDEDAVVFPMLVKESLTEIRSVNAG